MNLNCELDRMHMPLIEASRRSGLLVAQALLKGDGEIVCEALRHPLPPANRATRASLIAAEQRLSQPIEAR